jgi:anthranilate phosphoribosyltransferase
MRRLARRPQIPDDVRGIDIVGTGGDGSGSLNLSTAAALVTAACGQPVIKHGNRSISSRSGSADVLRALGMHLPDSEEDVVGCLAATGFTFLFAPTFHPAMKAIAPVRKALGVRTIFNILGPLTNPASPPYYLIGAFNPTVAELMAKALAGLPIERAFVVHGAPAWDEPTPAGPFLLFDVRPGSVRRETRDPGDYGFSRCSPHELAGGEADANAASIRSVLQGDHRGAVFDAVTLGAAIALEVTSAALNVAAGVEMARTAIEDGTAGRFLDALCAWQPVTSSQESQRV